MAFKMSKRGSQLPQQPQSLSLDIDEPNPQPTDQQPTTQPTDQQPTFSILASEQGESEQQPQKSQPQQPQQPEQPEQPSEGGIMFDFNDPSQMQRHSSGERENKFRRPMVNPVVEDDLKLEIDTENTTGEIKGSDYDKDGNLKKKRKPSGGKLKPLLSIVAILGLLGVIVVGATTFTNPVDNTPDDLTMNTPEPTPPPKEPVEPPVYEDDVPEEDLPEQPNEEPPTEGTPPLEGYLAYENAYTNFTLQYPENWFISENTQEGFNQIKENTKDGVPFSFKTATLSSALPLVTLKSPQVDNQEQIIIVAQPKDFVSTGVSAPLTFVQNNLTSLLKQDQPTITEKLGVNGQTFDVRYDIFKEYDDRTLTIHASTKLGENTLMVYYLVPYHSVGESVAEESDEPLEQPESGAEAGTAEKPKPEPQTTPTEKPKVDQHGNPLPPEALATTEDDKKDDKKPADKKPTTPNKDGKDGKEEKSEYIIELEAIKSEYLGVFTNVLNSLTFK